MNRSTTDNLLLCNRAFPTRELERWSPVPVASARRFDGATIRKNPLGVARILVGTHTRHVVVAVLGRYNLGTLVLACLGALPRATHRTLILHDKVSGEVSQCPFSRWQALIAWPLGLVLRWLVDTVGGWVLITYSYLWLTPQLVVLRRRDAHMEAKKRLS